MPLVSDYNLHTYTHTHIHTHTHAHTHTHTHTHIHTHTRTHSYTHQLTLTLIHTHPSTQVSLFVLFLYCMLNLWLAALVEAGIIPRNEYAVKVKTVRVTYTGSIKGRCL